MSEGQAEQLKIFHARLTKVTKFDEVVEISRAIFFMNLTKDSASPIIIIYAAEILELLQKHFASTKSIKVHKVLIKAIVKLAMLGEKTCFSSDFIEKYSLEHGALGSNCLTAYGRLQNYKLFEEFFYDPVVLYDALVHCSLKYSKTTKFFELAIENYIQAYDIKLVKKNHGFLMTVLCSNLENSHKNIHKLLLELFKRILAVADEDGTEIVNLILNDFSWYDRNKHYLLAQLITTRPEMLINHKDFNTIRFMNGLRCGLSQYHLYSSSLTVVKLIYDKNPFREELLKISLDILLNASEYEMKNFLRLWFTVFDDNLKNELFDSVKRNYDFSKVSSTSDYFYRSLIIRNAFNRPLSTQIENSVKSFCYSIDDVATKLEIFNILLNDIYSTKDFQKSLECIMRFLKFIHFNMTVEDSHFIDNIMRKLPNFFNHLATNKFHNKEVCKEIFTIIRDDIFLHGIKFGTYETKIFSLKLLEIMLKQYCGVTKGRRLSKKTDSKNNQEFSKYLRDNHIWDIKSVDIFSLLVEMTFDIENSDISGIANEIIIEYFIKSSSINENALLDGIEFREWLNKKMYENINVVDVEEYHENISYCKMKLEYLMTENYTEFIQELKELLSELNSRHKELKLLKDPVSVMQIGRSLFILIDVLNYGISRCDSNLLDKDFILEVIKLSKDIVLQFMDFINNEKSSPSFDMLDKNLKELVETSKSKCKDLNDMKHKLLLSFFFTSRALSELSVTLATFINNTLQPHEDDYFIALEMCISINIEILSSFCHKGAIETASQALGSITKIVSNEFLQQCDRTSSSAKNLQKLLIMLKHEIDCGKRHSSKTGEIRGSRGLVFMAHLIIRNHPPFLKFLMKQLLDLIEIESFDDTQKIKFKSNVQPIHLHLLAVIVKDSELVEDMLPYYDYILLCTFRAYKESKDFIMQNALLQIIGNITPKISNHKRHTIDESDMHYESKAISVYEYYVKFTYSFRIALFDLERNIQSLSQTYIIILLEIMSNFEFRKPYEYSSDMESMNTEFKKLIEHPCEKIRILAARCFAQWCFPNKLEKIIFDKVRYIFWTNPNLAHGSIVAVRNLIQRYEASIKFIKDFDKETFYRKLRQKVLESSQQKYSDVPTNFYLRYHLFEFLMFLGFNFNDDLIRELMNEENVKSTIGYQLWRKKIQEYERHRI